ncbi:Nn.00g057710.m01.CDS01 [Neocucurbitaria sp. VM-36]
MEAEPGPPPYTREQIAALATPEERTRARAELSSYIAWQLRRKEEFLRLEKEQLLYEKEQADRELDDLNGHSNHSRSGEPPKRGNYPPGYNRHHPYQRPQPLYAAQKYKNRSVTFGKPHSATGSSGASEMKNVSPKSANNKPPLTQNHRQQIEPKTLCSTFTSTGNLTKQ